MTATHPLDMLTGEEIVRATEILRVSGRVPAEALFAHMVLHEPEKETLARWQPDDPVERRVRVVVVPGPTMTLHEVVVSVTKGEIVDWRDHSDMRPALLITEAMRAITTTKEHPEYVAALAQRGITDLDAVQIDPWPAGVFGYECEDGRRITRCISFLRGDPIDNAYARPIEGLIVHFDMAANAVIEVIDHGVTSIPPNRASYYAEHQPALRDDLKPISITQPEGVSFTVAGNLVDWQKWQFRIGFDPYEGVVLHQISYADDGRRRSILHRASISEMVVPYGDPSPLHGWKNASTRASGDSAG